MTSEPPQRAPFLAGEGSPFVVRNLQRRRPVDGRRLRAFLSSVASALGEDRPATLALVNDARIRRLNRDFRGLDEPTDVLSFPSGEAPSASPYLGDIVISVDTADRQARRRRSTFVREVELLTLHGFLHLLGYDHQTDSGEMRRIEYRLRRKLGIRGKRGPLHRTRARGGAR